MQLFQNLLLAAAALLPAVFAAKAGDVVENSYIVVLNSDVSASALDSHKAWAADLHSSALRKRGDRGLKGLGHTYNLGNLKGYSGTFDKETIKEISARPDVAYIEPDRVYEATALVTQSGATWGLGRISHHNAGSTSYVYDSTAGAGVTAYVIDSGILTTHTQFGGRATFGYNAITGSPNTDQNGHGTHVAGTIGSTTYGVAKRVSLVAVKVLDANGGGTTAGVIAGIQWASTNSRGKRAVANMSLGGTYSAAINSAVQAAVSAGLTFVVAAGNESTDASTRSPASAPSAITVASIQQGDAMSYFSNYGSAVDVFAPGTAILSTYIGSNTATRVLDGTSMASPHVAGLAAYFLGLNTGLSSPASVANYITSQATLNVVTGGNGSPNRLAYNGSGL